MVIHTEFFKLIVVYIRLLLEIRVSQNLAKLGGGCTVVETLVASRFAYEAFRRFTSSCVFAYRLLFAIFVYHAPTGLHEVVPHAFPLSSCMTSLTLC